LAGYLGGEWTLAEARRRAVLATGQYTKRQATWLRHRGLADPSRARSFDARWPPSTQYSERILDELVQFVRERG
jgi:tRNA dimethylallyltransferase